MKHRRTRTLFVAASILFIALGLTLGLFGVNYAYAGKIPPGATVDGIPVGGQTEAEAINLLRTKQDEFLKSDRQITVGNTQVSTTLAQMGYSATPENAVKSLLEQSRKLGIFSIFNKQKIQPLSSSYTIDATALDAFINDAQSKIARDPVDRAITFTDGAVMVTPAQLGQSLDLNQSRAILTTQVTPSKTTEPITLPVFATQPTLATESQTSEAEGFLRKLTAAPLVITIDTTKFTLDPETLFSFVTLATTDGKLTATIDNEKVKAKIAEIARKVDQAAVTQKVSAKDGSIIAEGRDGKKTRSSCGAYNPGRTAPSGNF